MNNYIFIGVIVVVIILMFWWSSRSNKKRQKAVTDFRDTLAPGTPVATHSGLLGVIESIDKDREEVVINSEGSLSKWRLAALTEPPVVPNYVSDDEVDEEGNPLPQTDEAVESDETDEAVETVAADDAAPVEIVAESETEAEQSSPILK
jgi:preprotein translocase subunit YajC